MSHLSILPTVLRDDTVLFQALADLGLNPERDAILRGFADDRQPVLLRVQLPEGLQMGWSRQGDGSLALVGDLQRRPVPAACSSGLVGSPAATPLCWPCAVPPTTALAPASRWCPEVLCGCR
jgi:hypothetical protein